MPENITNIDRGINDRGITESVGDRRPVRYDPYNIPPAKAGQTPKPGQLPEVVQKDLKQGDKLLIDSRYKKGGEPGQYGGQNLYSIYDAEGYLVSDYTEPTEDKPNPRCTENRLTKEDSLTQLAKNSISKGKPNAIPPPAVSKLQKKIPESELWKLTGEPPTESEGHRKMFWEKHLERMERIRKGLEPPYYERYLTEEEYQLIEQLIIPAKRVSRLPVVGKAIGRHSIVEALFHLAYLGIISLSEYEKLKGDGALSPAIEILTSVIPGWIGHYQDIFDLGIELGEQYNEEKEYALSMIKINDNIVLIKTKELRFEDIIFRSLNSNIRMVTDDLAKKWQATEEEIRKDNTYKNLIIDRVKYQEKLEK